MHPPGWTHWTLDLGLLLVVALAVAYRAAYRRAAHAPGRRRPGIGHWLPFAGGLLALVAALNSPLDAIGDRWLLSAHMAQHLLLADIAPALLVLGLRAPILPLGLPRPALRLLAHRGPAGRVWALLTRPVVALPLWAIATWAWSIPAVFDFAAAHPLVHAVEHATLFWTGLALWWLIVDPLPSDQRRPHGQRLAFLAFTRAATAFVCVPLTWLGHAIYPLYAHAPRGYGLSPLHDQQLAGAGMCFVEFLVFGLAMGAVFLDVLARSDRAQALEDAHGWTR
jgi:cytochrome c oxidase assembly factor CtaG